MTCRKSATFMLRGDSFDSIVGIRERVMGDSSQCNQETPSMAKLSISAITQLPGMVAPRSGCLEDCRTQHERRLLELGVFG